MSQYDELTRLVERVLKDRRFCGDEHHLTLATGVSVLLAENGRLSAACTRAEQVINAESKAAAIAIGRANLMQTERDRLRAEVAGLRTGYEAYEQVNAELKAENERLRAGVKGDYDLDAWLDWTQEAEALRKLVSDTALELRKASSWICREVEAGTTSATHWAIRLREKADQIGAALGQGEQS